jgi:hypothetical protein
MDNPYWTTDGQAHHINLDGIKRLCFDISSIFESSRPISETIEYAEVEEGEPVQLKNFPLAVLHNEYSFKIISEKMLQIALVVRTYDDQMKESFRNAEYRDHQKANDDGNYIGSIDESKRFYLRDACNKIIHAKEVRPLYERIDRTVCDALEKGIIGQDFWYLTGEIELSGLQRGMPWHAVIYVQPFLETVLGLISYGDE